MRDILVKLTICVALGGGCLYAHLHQINRLTHLKMAFPALEGEVRELQETTHRLAYQIEQFENPVHLIDLARRPEFGHLHHPLLQEILTVSEGLACIYSERSCNEPIR